MFIEQPGFARPAKYIAVILKFYTICGLLMAAEREGGDTNLEGYSTCLTVILNKN